MLPKQPQEQLHLDYGDSMVDVTSIPNWRDMAAQQLVTFSQENPQTAGPYPVDELVNWLRENGLARYDTNGAWEGLLVSIAQNGQTPIAFRNGLVDMLSHLRNPKSVQVDTHLDSYAPLLGALLASTGLSDEQIAKFYALGGGRKYPLFSSEAEAEAAQAAAIITEDERIRQEHIAKEARERLAKIQLCRQAFDRVTSEIRSQIDSGVVGSEQIADLFHSAWEMAWPH